MDNKTDMSEVFPIYGSLSFFGPSEAILTLLILHHSFIIRIYIMAPPFLPSFFLFFHAFQLGKNPLTTFELLLTTDTLFPGNDPRQSHR